MNVIEGTGLIVTEPVWSLLLTDELERAAASEHWRRITTELRDREVLSASNAHAVQRLVLAYIVYDRCSREVAESGAVLKPKRGNPKSIARLSPYFTAMREAGSDADRQEQELGISPRRRSGAAKVERKARKTVGGGYLKGRG
ncbi:P27 family phage terminase small subunit [Sphingomonas paucimobilis]|uniref:P27 family phage terminase small subunit n=1 Tax=Sphingomonas paucimobilis TaxID=13689 RepID=UPI000DE28970|nr:P27 family phage terminase small subunit [Sphingomonas paucimobilis]QBE91914.1 P27 family phage terminase small subunit [Sphingomonas paucimobilis]